MKITGEQHDPRPDRHPMGVYRANEPSRTFQLTAEVEFHFLTRFQRRVLVNDKK
jgi:hypothetical protein